MQKWHRISFYPALKPIAHHQVVPFSELIDKREKITEIVAVVCVGHNHKFALGTFYTMPQSIPVTFLPDMYHPRTQALGNIDGVVGTAVVRHKYFSMEPMTFD
jgi:hypothetical protein